MSEHNKNRKENKKLINNIWLWIGVIVLCAILLFWIFDIGTFLGPNQ